eukprot:TRINITY_DN663_c0_g2_i1.p1 TRINITY_DN663_c0_g2~~TRINITY_DN663_c0_g2_i1.p1  ORF type:complete len:474 (-),score=133.16 TRINITY_DN663_c0_g2_i1:27-1421(-)
MKIQFILLALLITYTAALDINSAGNISATLGKYLNGDLNLGNNFAFGFGDILSLSASAKVTGTVKLGRKGNLGLGASTPTLEIGDGIQLNCSALVFNGGKIVGAGAIVIEGEAEFNAEAYVNASLMCASAVISQALTTSGEFVVGGMATVDTGIAFTAEAGAAVVFEAHVAGSGSIHVAGKVFFSAKSQVATAAVVAANLAIEAGGKAYVASNTTFSGIVQVAEALIVQAEGEASFSGSVSVSSGAVIAVEGSGHLSGSISGSGSIVFNATSVKESIITSAGIGAGVVVKGSSKIVASGSGTVFASLSLSGSGSAVIESGSSVSEDFECSGGATVEINGGSLSILGSARFEADATYKVHAESATSTNVIAVQGEASLNGNLVVVTDVEFSASTRLYIMNYGSRASGSTFASVTVMSSSGNKRSLLEDGEYEVVYSDSSAYIQKADNAAGSLFAAGLLLALLALF